MNPRKNLLVSSILVCLYLFSGCLLIRAEYSFDSWTTDEGLPQNGLREITQTPDGYLWFTTFDGLVRFDGVKFTTFNKANTKGIINSRFTSIYCDKTGTLYAATMENGVLTVYKNGVFTSYNAEQVPGHYIEFIKPDENGEPRFLVVEGNDYTRNWYYLRDGKFVVAELLDKNNPRVIYKGKTGAVWDLSASEITETRDAVKTVYKYKVERFDPRREVFEDSEGGLWISGVILVRLKDGKVDTFPEKPNFPINSDFHSFLQEDDGSIWFANGGKSAEGLGLIRYKDGKFSVFGAESGLSNSSVFSIFKDREGVVWLATNRGLNRLRKNAIKTYGVESGLIHSEVYPMFRKKNDEIWVGTIKGLNIFRDGKFETLNLPPGGMDTPEQYRWKNGEMSVQSLWEDRGGKMWIGVSGGVYVVEKDETKLLKGSETHHIFAIREDKNGDVWAASSKGLLRFQNYELKDFYTSAEGLPNDYMTTIFEDSRGRLWFGGFGGLSEFRDGRFHNYTTLQGLTGNYIRSIYEDKQGALWIGTYGEGLSRFKNDRFFNYTEDDGLPNNDVFAIEEDERGNFWISSNQGIYRIKKKELNDFADGQINRISGTRYGKKDGMLNNECNGGRQPASVRDREGHFWFPTQNGIAVVDPDVEIFNPIAPSVVIESAIVERNSIDINKGLFIGAGKKDIEIKFTGVSLIKSEQVKFKYKLEGYNTDWIDAGTQRAIYYSNLPPGNYRLLIKAANSDGVWNEESASLEIQLEPFFYQTSGFYFLCIAVGLLALFTIWKISVHQLEARERKLARLVAARTEELRKANEELQHLANSDGLTSVGNRRLFETFLSNEWKRAIRFKTEISLILLDVDHFKLFNDAYGHQAGDDCLKKVAEALKQTINRPTDLVARFGGEEFAVILGETDAEGALNIAEQIKENVKNLNILHQSSKTCSQITISIGVATTFADLDDSEIGLITMADKALYRAKAEGRNRITLNDAASKFRGDPILVEEFVT